MDTIKLIREIEKKIRKAEEYLPVLIEMLQKQKEIKLTYRIKDKNRILEKVMLFLDNPNFQGMDEIQILNRIGDIIGITVVIDRLDDSFETAGEIIGQLEGKGQVEFKRGIDHITDNGGPTGYKGLLLFFDSDEGIPFEIQVTDGENLAIRDETHEEFERIKYAKVRNLEKEPKKDDLSK